MVSIPCKIGDFVCQFIPIQIKIVLQKVQFPPQKSFKIKSFDDPRKTFENKKVLPVLLEEDFLSMIIDTVRLYSYILYIVSTVSQSNVHNRFTGDPTTHWIDRISIKNIVVV